MIKLQPGDYVLTEGMTEEQYHAVCKAFMDSGAGGKHKDFENDMTFIVWDKTDKTLFRSQNNVNYRNHFRTSRELTIDQILGSDNTKGAKEMNLQEAYKIMQANCGIEVGDTVKVLRKAENWEMGWPAFWNSPCMDKFVGDRAIVIGIAEDGPVLRGAYGNSFPFFVLELVKKGKKLPEPLEISSDKYVVFCEGGEINLGIHHLNFELIEKIYMTAKELKEQNND